MWCITPDVCESHQLSYTRGMTARITSGELTGLHPTHASFVIEYMKAFDSALAAERAGFARTSGGNLLLREDITEVLSRVLQEKMEAVGIDAEWVLMELVDNHYLARQQGKLTASNTSLRIIAAHAAVDAFAAEKVQIASDDQVRDILLRGRKRGFGRDMPDEDKEEEVEETGTRELTFF